jgi:4-methyl-5(b-hydroxyethyl)-thiazole monophosphate biosynthesis
MYGKDFSMDQVCVFLGSGFEEIEALTVVDILRRSNIEVTTVSIIGDLEVTGAHDITVVADKLFNDIDYQEVQMLVLPGGMPGTRNLQNHKGLHKQLLQFERQKKWIAAICAAPGILGKMGFLQGKRAVCYPGVENQLTGASITKNKVEIDGNIITGRGMGTAIDFALQLTAVIKDEKLKEEVKASIVYE